MEIIQLRSVTVATPIVISPKKSSVIPINFYNRAGVSKQKPYNNNRIERYHNTIKARTKIMGGMQNPRAILDGFTLHYNFN